MKFIDDKNKEVNIDFSKIVSVKFFLRPGSDARDYPRYFLNDGKQEIVISYATQFRKLSAALKKHNIEIEYI